MKLKLRIEDEHGTVQVVTVKPRTQVAFERHWSTPENPVRLDENLSMEQLYWLGWHALKRGESYDQWLETIDEVMPVVDEQEELDGPLVGGQPSGTLSPPPSNQGTVSLSTS